MMKGVVSKGQPLLAVQIQKTVKRSKYGINYYSG